jgi:hypothetical protein
MVRGVVGLKLATPSDKRREDKQKNENQPRHAPRIGRNRDRWQAKARTWLPDLFMHAEIPDCTICQNIDD